MIRFNGPGKVAAVLVVVVILSLGVHYQTIAQESEQDTIGMDNENPEILLFLLVSSMTQEGEMKVEDLRTKGGKMYLEGRRMVIEGTKNWERREVLEGREMMMEGKKRIQAGKELMK